MQRAGRAWLETRLRAAWATRGPIAQALRPLAALYAAVSQRQRGRQRSRAAPPLPVPVVVIGNVIAGGAGKTPTTIALARHWAARGHHPGIVSRGYGRATRDARRVGTQSTPDEVGDEALLIARCTHLPVAVGRDRAAAARMLLSQAPEIDALLCDDGLQHLALPRDMEICVFNGDGIGNGWLLPAGPLREPWPRHVDLILVTAAPTDARAVSAPPGVETHYAPRTLAQRARRANGDTRELTDLRGQPVTAVAAIARPQEFFAMLRDAGLTLRNTVALPDHADPTAALSALPPGVPLVCTEKDAAKLWRIRPDAWAVPLVLDIPAAFFARCDTLLATALRRRQAGRSADVPDSPPQ